MFYRREGKTVGRDISYLASLVLQVAHNLAKRVGGALGVLGAAVLKVGNLAPVLDNLLGGQGDVDGEAVAAGLLPAGLAAPAGADLVEATGGVGADVAAEGEDEGSNVVGLEGLEHLGGEDSLGHGSTSVGSNGVDVDVVLGTLDGQSARETEDTAFLRGVSGISDVIEQD